MFIANQSFGLAMMVVFMHAMGDVPSPIIVGYLKDSLAPGCVGKLFHSFCDVLLCFFDVFSLLLSVLTILQLSQFYSCRNEKQI